MILPNKEEAVRFFTDVKVAIDSCPEVFQEYEFDLKFINDMLKKLDGEWKPIDTINGLPGDLYEINKEGLVRDAKTLKVLEVFYDIDRNVHHVCIFFGDDKEWCIIGPRLADLMFETGGNS